MAKSKRKSSRKKRTTSDRGTSATRQQIEAAKSSNVDLTAEYAYVAQDLGRIGIIAGVLIGILVALSFFL